MWEVLGRINDVRFGASFLFAQFKMFLHYKILN
nr:MAG TPA: hypothetical protein [Caudoviricetes sp.]